MSPTKHPLLDEEVRPADCAEEAPGGAAVCAPFAKSVKKLTVKPYLAVLQ